MTKSQAFHRGTAPIFSILTAEQTKRLAELQGDPGLADRVSKLAKKANEGELSPSDREEYEAYIEANNLLAVLQAEARYRLTQNGSKGTDAATRAAVRARAGDCCEYCQRPKSTSPLIALQIEHVIPRKHDGSDDADNLALASSECNLHKGSDVTGIDPDTGHLTRLFNPRIDRWDDHFAWEGLRIVGRSAIGRTTVRVPQLNAPARLRVRRATQTD